MPYDSVPLSFQLFVQAIFGLGLLAKEPAAFLRFRLQVPAVVDGLIMALCTFQLGVFILEDVACASAAGVLGAAAESSGNTVIRPS